MTITVTWPMVVYITGIILSWSGFLIGLIRWSLKRNLASFEEKLSSTAAIATSATQDLATHKAEIQKEITGITTKLNSMPTGCNGHQLMDTRVGGHSDRLAQHKELINTLEADLKHLPKTADIEKLHGRIDKVIRDISGVQSEVSKIAGAMPGITHASNMITDFLLHGGKQ